MEQRKYAYEAESVCGKLLVYDSRALLFTLRYARKPSRDVT